MVTSPQRKTDGRRDLFISHASEDKDFVGPLAGALSSQGLEIWYDEYELQIGDRVRDRIDQGLIHSRFGLVVLSPKFFEKHWTQYEFDGLIARQMAGEQVILPIWHRLTMEEITQRSPSLTNIFALNSSTDSVEGIARKVAVKVKGTATSATVPTPTPVSATPQSRTFGIFYVAPQGTPELPPGQLPTKAGFMPAQRNWLSVTATDEELEYILDGNSLRVRLDYGNNWSGDEIQAIELVTSGEPFALIIRHANDDQFHLPSVTNTSQGRSRPGQSNRSGWMVFEVR